MLNRYKDVPCVQQLFVSAILFLLLIFVSPAFSASGVNGCPMNSSSNQNSAASFTCALSSAGPVTNDNVSSGESNKIVVSAGTKDKNASINFTLSPSAASNVTSLSVTAPLDNNNESEFATLDGFSNSYNATLNFKLFNARKNLLLTECTEARQAIYNEIAKIDSAAVKEENVKTNMTPDCGDDQLNSLLGNAAFKHTNQDALQERTGYTAYMQDKKDVAAGRYKSWWFGGMTGTFGTNQYKYVDSSTAAQSQETKNSWGISAYIGVINVNFGVVLLNYAHQLTPKEGTTTTLCNPSSISAPFKCATGPQGAPQLTDKNVISIGLRMESASLPLAWSPSINHDFVAKTNGIDVPIYLIPGSQGTNYTGGIRFGWRSDTHDITAVIFVGSNFDYYSTSGN